MSAAKRSRPSVEALYAYDLAVCAWIENGGGGEVPFWEAPPMPAEASLFGLSLAGFDEAGRGSVAGPVVVGCVHYPLAGGRNAELLEALRGVGDSKQLTARQRVSLYERITEIAAWGVGAASAVEIDRAGIVPACRAAGARAFANLGVTVDAGLFDRGLSLAVGPEGERPLRLEASAVGADARSLHVASASIVAKVTRDRWMTHVAERFPEFGLERHKGYGTAAHMAAIRRLGPTRIHRRTFLTRLGEAETQSC